MTPETDTGLAKAKVNLTLHVGEKRSDGYHTLESLVVFADIGDRVSVSPALTLSLGMEGSFAGDLDSGENLILKAARQFAARTGHEVHANIRLEKLLPVSSGLGGGSADAAAALRAFGRMHGVPEAVLLTIAADVGSDVPACVVSRGLMMRGRGEVLETLPILPELSAVLVNARIGVSTSEVFARLRQRTGHGRAPQAFDLSGAEPLIRYLRMAQNDLEAPALALAPVIGEVLDELARMPGMRLARMSGSGATCFGLFDTRFEADLAATALGRSHPNWWILPASLR